MSDAHRSTARQICREALARGEPLAWFDELYLAAVHDEATVPWADLEPNPNLVRWQNAIGYEFTNQRCLKVGCGLGDDCEFLQQAGGSVTGFDVSTTAIDWCRRRFPDSGVSYHVEDLFNLPDQWRGSFDFVLESYTLQVLPPELRADAVAAITRCVAENGTLLVIARARDESSPAGEMPWPITKSELMAFTSHDLSLVELDDYQDDEDPPVRRFRACFKRN